MVDSGAGQSSHILEENIRGLGFDLKNISTLILTHCHVDHIGSAKYFRDTYGCRIIAHELDADAIETGDDIMTAASWYNTRLPKTPVDRRIIADHEILFFGDHEIHCLHTPGHTPGSVSLYIDRNGKRVLFGQDIHGPFTPEFKSDIAQWRESMENLLGLEADILCEGHFGIFRPKNMVKKYILRYLKDYMVFPA